MLRKKTQHRTLHSIISFRRSFGRATVAQFGGSHSKISSKKSFGVRCRNGDASKVSCPERTVYQTLLRFYIIKEPAPSSQSCRELPAREFYRYATAVYGIILG